MGLLKNLFKRPEPEPVRAPQAPKETVERMKVAGTSFRQEEIRSIGEKNEDCSLTKRELLEDFEGEKVYALDWDPDVRLVPEPENEHDKNALAVIADGVRIGYVPKKEAVRVRELMDSGRITFVDAEIRGGKYKRAYEGEDLDRGEDDFFATLKLKIKVE